MKKVRNLFGALLLVAILAWAATGIWTAMVFAGEKPTKQESRELAFGKPNMLQALFQYGAATDTVRSTKHTYAREDLPEIIYLQLTLHAGKKTTKRYILDETYTGN